jgi:hypothetical protein
VGVRTSGTWTVATSPKKGSRKVISKHFRKNIRALFEEYGHCHYADLKKAIDDGIHAEPPKSFPYIQMWAHYCLGKPVEKVEVSGKDGAKLPVTIVFELAKPPQQVLTVPEVKRLEAGQVRTENIGYGEVVDVP